MRPTILILTAIVGASQPAAAQNAQGFFSASGRGASGWTMTCNLEQPSGRVRETVVRGRGRETVHIARRGIASAKCTYQAGEQGFELRVDTDDFACPFEIADAAKCARGVAPGESGEFTAQLKARD